MRHVHRFLPSKQGCWWKCSCGNRFLAHVQRDGSCCYRRNPGSLRGRVIAKLHPRRFTAMSPKMAAMVGAVLGADYTTPRLVKLSITGDGFVMGMAEGDIGYNHFLGSEAEFQRNWDRLLDAADLTGDEWEYAQSCFHRNVANWRTGRGE